YVIVPVMIAMFLAYFQLWVLAGIFAFIALFMAFFFRDPYRESPEGDGLIFAGCDGTVTRIDNNEDGKPVSVFMSPLDVHSKQSPICGKTARTDYMTSKQAPATDHTRSVTHERPTLTVEAEGRTNRCTRIAGIMERRIVRWRTQGDDVARRE